MIKLNELNLMDGRKCCLLLMLVSTSVLWVIYESGVVSLTTLDSTITFSEELFIKQSIKNNSYWIVVTNVSSQNDVIRYTNMSAWSIVIVGDMQTPESLGLAPNSLISVEDPRKNLELKEAFPKKSYSSKNIGFLIAIANGATVIYEVDNSRILFSDIGRILNQTYSHSLQVGGRGTFNPYKYFGQADMWPRGYPLTGLNDTGNNYYTSEHKKPSIVQIINNGHPDIDETLTYAYGYGTNVTFDSKAPVITLNPGIWAPISSRNTLYQYESLWATVVPITPPILQRDIMRGYWAQRLIWEIGGKLGFVSSEIYHDRIHKFHQPNKSRMCFKASEIIHFLQAWTCSVKFSFFQCVESLSKAMVDAGFWKLLDYKVIKTWLQTLRGLGYAEPVRIPYSVSENNTPKKTNAVFYQPAEQKSPGRSALPLKSKWKQVLGITSICQNTSYQIDHHHLEVKSSSDVVLVVVFNYPFYDNIPYLQLMYGVIFTYIVYCGPDSQLFQKASGKHSFKVTFVESEVDKGYYAHKCLSAAMKMNYRVRGYLMIGDDTLLNSWQVKQLPLDKIWYDFAEMRPLFRNQTSKWHWWQKAVGRSAFNKAWQQLLQLSQNPRFKYVIETFVKTLRNNTGSEFGLFHAPSDILYIPSQYANNTIFFFDIFAHYKLFLETAIPTLVCGFGFKTASVDLQGQYLWYGGKREQVPQLFNPNHTFLHPVKLSNIKSSLRTFFCEKFFPLTLYTV